MTDCADTSLGLDVANGWIPIGLAEEDVRVVGDEIV